MRCFNGTAVPLLPEQGSRAAGLQSSRDAGLQPRGLSVMTLVTLLLNDQACMAPVLSAAAKTQRGEESGG